MQAPGRRIALPLLAAAGAGPTDDPPILPPDCRFRGSSLPPGSRRPPLPSVSAPQATPWRSQPPRQPWG